MKTKLIYFLFFLCFNTMFSQWTYENIQDLKQDVIINYAVIYDNKLTDKQKQSSKYISEIVVLLNKKKLLTRKINPRRTPGNFTLLDYEKEKMYKCYESKTSKAAIVSDFKEPAIEGILQEGKDRKIAGLTCQRYISFLKGKPVELCTTKEIGLRYINNYNVPGMLMQYRAYDKYLGFYTVRAVRVKHVKLPEATFSIKKYNIVTEEEEIAYKKKQEEKRKEFNEKKEKTRQKYLGKKSPDFYARTIKNKKISTKKMIGHDIVVLNFWFSTCGPCKAEIPKLNALKKQYSNNKNIQFIAVGLDTKSKILDFLKEFSLNFDIVEEGRWIASKFDITSYPTNIIIDKEGIVQFYKTGYNSNIKTIMTNKIDELLDR